jgi:carbamoyltransferase
MRDAYLGPEFTPAEIRSELEREGLSFTEPQNLAAEVARRIHSGEVIARFDGRMEYGPRALGNRSILYHAREPDVNQWLNERLGRTEFMPFAPVTLWEARERCYVGLAGAEHTAEFMTITFDCTPWMRENCPAAVHVDGTARPQLIRREINPGYYDIVAEYEKLSGIPCLINTSFNMHEEPIVCTPHDAVRAFVQGNLDGLAIGPYLVA